MNPDPDPSATTPTIIDKTKPATTKLRAAKDRRGAARAGVGMGRVVVGITAVMFGVACGMTAAVLAATAINAGEMPKTKSVALAAVAGPSLAGRWSGTPHVIRNDASRCANGDCKIVLDIVPCTNGWCAVEVDKANACTAEVMQLKTHTDAKRRNAFEGKLSLGRGTQDYVIDATFMAPEDDAPAMLEIVGDTGPEFRWFRRSFPFHAALARMGDGKCSANDKPVS